MHLPQCMIDGCGCLCHDHIYENFEGWRANLENLLDVRNFLILEYEITQIHIALLGASD
jgi:hypothetical protein